LNNDIKDIRKISSEEIDTFLEQIGEKVYRRKQIERWLWKQSVGSFDEMKNIPSKTLTELKEKYIIAKVKLYKKQDSSDGTIKSGFKLHDGYLVEGVLIPSKNRITACISSQVGCSLTCKFCATGQIKLERNLDAAEIYDQVVEITKQAKRAIQQVAVKHCIHGDG